MPTTTELKTEEQEMKVKSYVDEEFQQFFKEVVERSKDVSTHVVPAELAREILTKKRMEMIHKIREKEELESKRDLARKLDRDIKAVSRDLDTLWKYGIINYEEAKNRKIPELTADKIIIEPL
jgi:predicted transcriptional regulator